MRTPEDKFQFFVPLSTIEKAGEDTDGNPIMRIGGIASTSSVDADDESLDPHGFDLSRLTKSGNFNWQHQTNVNPAAIIGHPDVAKIVDGKLYVEGNLYGSSKMAREVYALQKALEKEGSGRSLGFSIEGKATHRCPKNPKKVLKAILTGIAVTPTPKNSDTIMSILKGEGSGLEPEYDEVVEGVLLKVESTGGDATTLSKSGEITLSKADAANVLLGEEKNSEKKSGENLHSSSERGKFEPYLSKSQVYAELIPFVNTPAEARSLYNVIGALHNGDMSTLTKEAINKGLENLALLGNLDVDALTKGAVGAALGDDDNEPIGAPNGQPSLFGDNLQKSETELELEATERRAAELRDLIKKGETTEPEAKEVVTVGLDAAAVQDLLQKGFDNFGGALSGQMKPFFDQFSTIAKSLVEQNTELTGKLDTMSQDLETIKKQPLPGKTITKSYQNNELNPQGENKEVAPTGLRLNVDNPEQREQLVKALSADTGFGTDNYNAPLGKAIARLQTTGEISEPVLNAAKARNITVTRSQAA